MTEALQFVIITGLSGAGKSQAMDSFEDAGWFCVDNLPPELVPTLVDLFRREGSKVDRVAVVSDVRGGEYFEQLEQLLDELHERGVEYTLVFLEASNEALVRRFKETRRRHPLAGRGTRHRRHPRGAPPAGRPARARQPHHRHQRHLDPPAQGAPQRRPHPAHAAHQHRLRRGVVRLQVRHPHRRGPAVRRPLPAQPALRPAPAFAHRAGRGGQQTSCSSHRAPSEYLERLFPLLDFLFPRYAAEGKAHLTIGIGCTGGRHRSVAIAQLIGERYEKQGYYTVVRHRDLTRD